MRYPSSIVLICEDKAQKDFALGFLKGLGYHLDKVSRHVHAQGKGDAKAFVAAKIEEEVDLARRHHKFKPTCIIAVRDVDTDQRSSVRASIVAKAKGYDDFVVVLPERNMETWLQALSSEDTIDVSSKKSKGREKKQLGQRAYRLGKALAHRCKNKEQAPEPLQSACRDVAGLVSSL